MDEFTVGDLVQLKSGGQEMTVQNVEQKIITCQWFAGSKLLQRNFVKEMLIKIDDSQRIKSWKDFLERSQPEINDSKNKKPSV